MWINGKQSVKLTNCSIKFKNHFKQLAEPFMTLLTNLYELMINLTNKLFFTEEKIQPIFKQFLKKLNIAKKQ